MDIKLYRVEGTVPVFRARKDVRIDCVISHRGRAGANPYEGRYEEVIQDYEDHLQKLVQKLHYAQPPLDIDAQNEAMQEYENNQHKDESKHVIDELFTLEEAEQFISWMKRRWPEVGVRLEIQEVDLPIESDTPSIFYRKGRFTKTVDILEIREDGEYNLPYEVRGYCDLEGCELDTATTHGTDYMDEQIVSLRDLSNKNMLNSYKKILLGGDFDKDGFQDQETE